ncbi:MAG: MFS transporter, partial [Caldilineaceae bacterium SB0675_bin_29]|nr:MFS transporter [Caldilineaceae bacterium SB0675_bin_29]
MNPSDSLWRNRSFTRLWVAHVTSGAGTAITNVALPLAAVLVLGATPTQMGLLAAAGSLPNLLFGLLAGVWVDRVRRKPILIWADIGRSLLLVTIPVAAWLGQLSFLQIWLVTFATGTLTVFFQIAAISVLPALVEKGNLVEANSKLSTSDAVIAIAGPAAAGGLVQLFSAPRAILVDAFSYLLSAIALGGVAEEEPQPASQPDRDDAPEAVHGIRAAAVSIGREVGEGVFELLRTPLLSVLTITSSLGMLAGSISAAVQMLFLVNQLNFTPSIIGIVAACSGIGSLAGAMLAG